MNYRTLGRTGWKVSEISFGTWAIGGSWGEVDDSESLQALRQAIDRGVNFLDTADVYGDGRSERLCAQIKRERKEEIIIATKAGRRLNPHAAEGYKNLTPFVERSLKNLGTGCLDLLQLHCPPTDVYYMPEVFDALDGLVEAGKIRYYGVSVERIEEAIKGDGVHQRSDGANHLQHFPSAAGWAFLRAGKASQSGSAGTCATGERLADGETSA